MIPSYVCGKRLLLAGFTVVLVSSVFAQTAFVDFNIPGQYTNNFNPWNDAGGNNGSNYPFAESTSAGVNGGGVSIISSTETTAAYRSAGTDGFGRSDTRERLRRFFEVDAESTALATLNALAEKGQMERSVVAKAIKQLDVDPGKGLAAHSLGHHSGFASCGGRHSSTESWRVYVGIDQSLATIVSYNTGIDLYDDFAIRHYYGESMGSYAAK